MSWQFNPWGGMPQQPQFGQQPYILVPAPNASPVTYGPKAKAGKKMKPKAMVNAIREYREAAEELEKMLKKEDKKKSSIDPVKLMILLVLSVPIIGPLYVMWIRSLFG